MKFLKKLLHFIKFICIGIIWSYMYLYITSFIFKKAWDFNYLSKSNWSIISDFWQGGGKIITGMDYLFILCLLLLVPLWIWGWRKLNKLNFILLLFKPVEWAQNRSANNYLKEMSRIKLHNIGASVGEEIKQNFENELKMQQKQIENTPRASQSIRSQLKSKLSNKP